MPTQTLPVRLERRGSIAVLTLNRPSEANAINLPLANALAHHAAVLKAEGWARAIVLRAEGKLFCGGGDVATFSQQIEAGGDSLAVYLHTLIGSLHRAILALLALDAPLIAAVQGTAAGAGMSLVLAADLAYGAPKIKLAPAYAGIGLSADGGMSWFLPRLVGARRAAELMLLNTPVDAQSAVELGLLTGVIDLDGEPFFEAVMAKAERAAAGPRKAAGEVRNLLRQSLQASLEAHLSSEQAAMVRLAKGRDVVEGLAALTARRSPAFSD